MQVSVQEEGYTKYGGTKVWS